MSLTRNGVPIRCFTDLFLLQRFCAAGRRSFRMTGGCNEWLVTSPGAIPSTRR